MWPNRPGAVSDRRRGELPFTVTSKCACNGASGSDCDGNECEACDACVACDAEAASAGGDSERLRFLLDLGLDGGVDEERSSSSVSVATSGASGTWSRS
jgi:hypothetical protein